MFKKFMAIFLVFGIVIFNIDSTNKDAQAFFGIDDAIEISIVAGALVESGAVGDVEEIGSTYSGSLWQAAQNLYYEMGPTLTTEFQAAVARATNGYFLLSSCPDVSTYINNHIVAGDINVIDTPLDAVPSFINTYPNSVAATVVTSHNLQGIPILTNFFVTGVDGYSCIQLSSPTAGVFGQTDPLGFSAAGDTFTTTQVGSMVRLFRNGVDIYDCNSPDGTFTNVGIIDGFNHDFTVTYGGSQGDVVKVPSSPLTNDMAISIPKNPAALSGATAATAAYTNTADIPGSILGTPSLEALGQAAKDAGDSAFKAAVALGLSFEAAQAAAKAASDAIAGGLTSDQAAQAGKTAAAIAAATKTATLGSGGLTTDIAKPTPYDKIDTSSLVNAAMDLSHKFPFSLPWDLQRMIQSFSPGAVTAPVLEMPIMGIPAHLDLAQFNDLAAAARIFELLLFNAGLLFNTRRLLGGAS